MDSQIDRTRLIVPGMAGVYQRFAPYSYAFMRFVTGAILVPHGIQKVFTAPIDRYVTSIGGKGIPFPELLAYLVFFTESVGAICLAIAVHAYRRRHGRHPDAGDHLPVSVAVRLLLDQPRLRVRADVDL